MLRSEGTLFDVLTRQGRTVPMPDATPDARSALLQRDPVTRARTLVVEFPAGFDRPVTGRYAAAEEVFVLSGRLRVCGLDLAAGDWAWLPAGVLRTGLASPTGALVYAWFSAGNDWQRSTTHDGGPPPRSAPVPAAPDRVVPLRGGSPGDGPGSSAAVPAGTTVTGPAEYVGLTSHRWTLVEAGERLIVDEPAFVRYFAGGS